MWCATRIRRQSTPLFALAGAAAIACGQATISRAIARPVQAPAPAATGRAPVDAAGGGLRIQPLDNPAAPLDPQQPRTEAQQRRLDALALYLSGRIQESRNDFKGAYETFRKAIEIDPTATEIYRDLVPLAFRLNRDDDAIKFAFKAVELDPQDYQLLRRLGVFLAAKRRIPEAIKLMEQAAGSKRIDKSSSEFVTINRDLGILYGAVGEKEKAADAYTVVFKALLDPEKYHLDQRTRASLEIDPNTSFERLGQIFLDAKKIELAVQAFEAAAKDARGKPGNLSYNLARVYSKTEKYDEALAQLQKYFDAELQSKGREPYELLAEILKAMDKSDELIGRLEKLVKKDSHNASLQLFLADQYVAAKRLDDAEATYKEALKTSSDISGYLGLVAVYRMQNRPRELIGALSKGFGGARTAEEMQANLEQLASEMQVIQADRKLVDTLISTGVEMSQGDDPQLDFSGSFILAKLAGDVKNIDAAVALYRFALEARADRASAIYSELGALHFEMKQYGEAAKIYSEASTEPALAGEWPMWLFRLSQAHEMNGNTAEAVKAIQEARKGLPENPLLHYQEAWIHYHARQFDKAAALYEDVIESYKQPQFQDTVRRAQFSLSNIYVQQGQFAKGEAILLKVLEEDPDNPSVNNDLGYLWADRGMHLERAEKMIRLAIKAEPENPAYLDSMGWVLFKRGKFDEAIPHLEKAVSLPGGSDPTIWDHLGDCYDRAGKADKASEAWNKALEEARKQPTPDEKIIKKIEEKLAAEPDSE